MPRTMFRVVIVPVGGADRITKRACHARGPRPALAAAPRV